MTVAFLSLGSNIEPEKNMLEAVRLLSHHVKVLKASTVYLTEPLQGKSQPEYYNCVIKVETDIEPLKLKFDVLRPIEAELGRKRIKDKFASRTIDIDIILYGNLAVSTKELVLPDPDIQERAFLAIPLCEIEPDLVLPVANKPIREVADRFKKPQIKELKSFTAALQRLVNSLGV
ncbi:MAG TPA: 2-amino-4-hydroxy-6-hydroxymethyldihydropteridine diphosphokinase [candidate division Zixibacteria bacterium]|nr:2-amino-4-hydroxy-6-hydroxymethyldihydropteridine diphosphokinase [candidate division Zixibacteria bacterium]